MLKLYIAGTGMITSVGANTAMTAAFVRAEASGYTFSEYTGRDGQPVKLASVPNGVFETFDANLIEGDRFNVRHHRVIVMAIIALREACASRSTRQSIPLLLAMPEGQADDHDLSPFVQNLEQHGQSWISTDQCRKFHGGRAAGMEALHFAFTYLHDQPFDYLLLGGSDSHRDDTRLEPLAAANRLLAPGNKDGFVPGEAACFLLLTRHPHLAQQRNGQMIALHPPGMADEAGHLFSHETYRGDGLDQAFKKALLNQELGSVHTVYTSLNGEHYWAKEYGVAHLRNREYFHDPVTVEHPADCFGDLGAATAPVLIALAAENLWKYPKAQTHLAYSSSDGPRRGAVVVEKIAVNAAARSEQPTRIA